MVEDDSRMPTSPYGLSKLAAEELVGLYARERGVPSTVLRYFTVYGPRQRPEMALARFVSAAIEGRGVEIFGDGDQVREMTYVSDVVGATVAALKQAPRSMLRTYNVGGGTRTTVNGMLTAVRRVTGSPWTSSGASWRRRDSPSFPRRATASGCLSPRCSRRQAWPRS